MALAVLCLMLGRLTVIHCGSACFSPLPWLAPLYSGAEIATYLFVLSAALLLQPWWRFEPVRWCVRGLALAVVIGVLGQVQPTLFGAVVGQIPEGDTSFGTAVGIMCLAFGTMAATLRRRRFRGGAANMACVALILGLAGAIAKLLTTAFGFGSLPGTEIYWFSSLSLVLLAIALQPNWPTDGWIADLTPIDPEGGPYLRLGVVLLFGLAALSAALGLLAIRLSQAGAEPQVVSGFTLAAGVCAVLVLGGVCAIRWGMSLRAEDEIHLMIAIANGQADAAFLFSRDHRCLYQNPAALALLGGRGAEEWFRTEAFHDLQDRSVLPVGDAPISLLHDTTAQGQTVGWIDPTGAERILKFSVQGIASRRAPQSYVFVTVGDLNAAHRQNTPAATDPARQAGVALSLQRRFELIQLATETAMLAPQKMPALADLIRTVAKEGQQVSADLPGRSDPQQRQLQEVNLAKELPLLLQEMQCNLPEGVRLDFAAESERMAVTCIRADLLTAVTNLVENAARALVEKQTGPGTHTIRMRLSEAVQDQLRLCVCDDGIGIPAQHLARVKDPYFSGWGTTGHRGLGLSQVEQFAQTCGGDLQIRSSQNQGTTVNLWLRKSRLDQLRPDLAELAGHRLLILEEDVQYASVLQIALVLLGADCTVATSPSQLRTALDAGPVSAVLIGLSQTFGSPSDLLHRFWSGHHHVPILALPTSPHPDSHAGCDMGMAKIVAPLSLIRLSQEISHAISKAQRDAGT